MDADDSLLDLVFDRLAHDRVPGEVADLVLAAYTGADALQAALAGESPDLPASATDGKGRPNPLYLAAVTVAGFRGVGPSASLRLQPGPGLTLVVGRNGSGKSSFAEAAELALTGDSARWAERNSVFREGWRNLHQGSPCVIRVDLHADGTSHPIQISRTWAEAATDPGQATGNVLANGTRYRDTDELGWRDSLRTYRPFLTANDLGRLISSTPSGLFDALAPILGIEPITEADKRLMHARKEVDDRIKAVRAARDQLRAQLEPIDDDRARRASALLAHRRLDLDALDALLAGADDETANPIAAACRRLVADTMPELGHALRVADELDAAAHSVAVHAAQGSVPNQQIAGLLERAIAYHDAHGDAPCPVCGTGTLDADWRTRSIDTLGWLRAETAEADQARRRLDDARVAARALLGIDRPAVADDLTITSPALGKEPEQLSAALTAWRAAARETGAEEVAAHIRSLYPPLHDAFAAVQVTAGAWLRQRHDAWREHAAALQDWLYQARGSTADETALGRVKAARDWLKRAGEELRAQRLAPFAHQSQEIWEHLRQESNVELAGMRLDGTSTRRRVAFPATVDGTATSAMAVMSQGELQALGLAVFLPRACAEASPFKFLILDDPVHSMDPAKVDGLAQVLDDLARKRQVVVFTHDNRLPEAVRRLQVDATIWEVMRREGSIVELRKNLDPVARYLDDANALARTSELADEVRRPVVSGFCRSAIEAACHERIRRERIGRGEAHAIVEDRIEAAQTLTQSVALALFGDHRAGAGVLPALNAVGGWAADVFKACQDNVHGAARGSLQSLVDNTARLIKEIR
jgi:predicted ATPase